MGQPVYTKNLLTKMRISNCNLVETPVVPGSYMYLVKATEEEEAVDQQKY